MLINSIPTVLIPAQEWARRPGNRRGSVACTEQGRGSEITSSQPSVRVSHVWLKCFLEGETQRGVKMAQCHTVIQVAFRVCVWGVSVRPSNQPSRRTSNEEANGVESRPNHDVASYSINVGSPKQMKTSAWRRSSNSTQGWPVMGSAVGNQADRGAEHKLTVMLVKPLSLGGSGTVFVVCLAIERRVTSVI